jgi:catechol 2,3-dioxygenase-like lactoylglutathione lyase family enzyme
MTTLRSTTTRSGVAGIVQVSVPVSDLARSAAWYRDLLGLTYVREFSDAERVTGCALVDWTARYMIALRLRSTIDGSPDLRGEHPIVLEAADEAAAGRLRTRAEELGVAVTGGVHADGTWLEFLDPDGIALRVVHSAAGPSGFLGVGADGCYDTPRLALSGVDAHAR